MSYNPTLGRWAQRDPIGYADGMNVYQAVLDNPVNFVDPTGLSAEPDYDDGSFGVEWATIASTISTSTFTRLRRKYTIHNQPPTMVNNGSCKIIKEGPERIDRQKLPPNTSMRTTQATAPGQVGRPEGYTEDSEYQYEYRQVIENTITFTRDTTTTTHTKTLVIRCKCSDQDQTIDWVSQVDVETQGMETVQQTSLVQRRRWKA